ncbi:MAG: DNA polymerase III subunit gamma/tau, partial [Eubacteriales bacterium]|nr:DNA polymerase III subunit gamma/tau [Eubacteriales bacterium]
MAYTALYRKLRPKSFNEVIGQEHIIKTLRNQYETERITHAYLFCGTRGTGKTSTAKIFAKLLNCENSINNSPCGKCELCVAFNENRSLNIFEIDAASNNSVDDIREIREEIKYPPTKGKYKVYIIDEVHMLSIGAFNALLKTLEEPPSYVIFILATTDPQKIPVTILSRCQRFDFKRISTNDMVCAIKENIANENIDIDDEALKYIAIVSDGAMRDALSILEQCNSFYFGEKITLEKVLEILGSVDDDILFKLTDALIELNSLECINIIDDIILNGRDILQFIADLIQHFRNIIISGVSSVNIIDISDEKFQKIKKQYEKSNSEYFIKLINI